MKSWKVLNERLCCVVSWRIRSKIECVCISRHLCQFCLIKNLLIIREIIIARKCFGRYICSKSQFLHRNWAYVIVGHVLHIVTQSRFTSFVEWWCVTQATKFALLELKEIHVVSEPDYLISLLCRVNFSFGLYRAQHSIVFGLCWLN